MITKQQYFRLSLVLFLPLLGLGYYLADQKIFDRWEYTISCLVANDGTCSTRKIKYTELKEVEETNMFFFKDSNAGFSSFLDLPLRSYILDFSNSEYREVANLNYSSFYQCSFQVLYSSPNIYSFDCYLDEGKNRLVSGKFDFINGIDEQWYLKTHAASLKAKKEISLHHQNVFYLTLFFPLFLYFLISCLMRFVIYGFRDSN